MGIDPVVSGKPATRLECYFDVIISRFCPLVLSTFYSYITGWRRIEPEKGVWKRVSFIDQKRYFELEDKLIDAHDDATLRAKPGARIFEDLELKSAVEQFETYIGELGMTYGRYPDSEELKKTLNQSLALCRIVQMQVKEAR